MIIKFLLVFKGDFFYFDVSAGDSMDIPGDFMLLSSKKKPGNFTATTMHGSKNQPLIR